MKSINRIEVKNFQSHAHTILDLAPTGNLTVITGNSDSGKTAVIRALRWVFYNQPQGTEFIRVGCTSAQVAVTMDDGWGVTRLRTPSKNQYIVTHPDGDAQTYEGFGVNVPTEVQQVLGVAPIDVGDMDLKLNIAEQLDGPFLGNSIAASFRAKVLGKLAGTEEVDVAGKQLGTDIYRHDRDVDSTKAQLEVKSAQIEELAWVEGLGVTIAELEMLAQTIKSKQEQVKALKGLSTRHAELAGRMEDGKAYLSRYQGLEEALGLLGDADKNGERKSSVHKLQVLFTNSINYQQHLRDRLQVLAVAEEANKLLIAIDGKENQRMNLIGAYLRHENVAEALEDTRDSLQVLQEAPKAHDLVCKAHRLCDLVSTLEKMRTRYAIAHHDLRSARATCAALAGVAQATDVMSNASGAVVKLKDFRQIRDGLGTIRQSRETTLGSLELAKDTLGKATHLYHEALSDAGVCPTCGAKAHEFKLQEVI